MRAALGVTLAALVAALFAACGGDVDAGPPAARPAFPSAGDPSAPAVVYAVGDGDSTPEGMALGRAIARAEPDRFLYLGDVYPDGSPEAFRTSYAPAYGALAPITAPTPGNHEWVAHEQGYDPFWRAATGEPTPPWYAFSIGGWRVVSLDSQAPHGAASPQLGWLRREVRRRDAGTCRLAIWHRPRESAGEHGDDLDVQPFLDALRGHAAVTLHGHDHDSQRLRPRDGLHGYVAGAGGRSSYAVDRTDPRLRFADDTHVAALRLVLRPGRARIAFVTADGEVLDRSTVRCRPAR